MASKEPVPAPKRELELGHFEVTKSYDSPSLDQLVKPPSPANSIIAFRLAPDPASDGHDKEIDPNCITYMQLSDIAWIKRYDDCVIVCSKNNLIRVRDVRHISIDLMLHEINGVC